MLGLPGPGQGAKCRKWGPWGSLVHRPALAHGGFPWASQGMLVLKDSISLLASRVLGTEDPALGEGGFAKLGGSSKESKIKYTA